MTEQQIIEWAREAGGVVKQNCLGNPMFEFTSLEITRFVNTVAAHAKADERDRMCELFGISKELAHAQTKKDETSRTKVLGKSK